MSDPNSPAGRGPRTQVVYLRSHRSEWTGVLLLACLALGFAASIAEYERVMLSAERQRAEALATRSSLAEGQLEDIGKFLSDSHTRLTALHGMGSAGNDAVVAWNSLNQDGYFFCDDLPVLEAGSGYELWALHGTDVPVKLATIHAEPGASVYPFRSWPSTPGKLRLEVTAGPRNSAGNPIFAGEIE